MLPWRGSTPPRRGGEHRHGRGVDNTREGCRWKNTIDRMLPWVGGRNTVEGWGKRPPGCGEKDRLGVQGRELAGGGWGGENVAAGSVMMPSRAGGAMDSS